MQKRGEQVGAGSAAILIIIIAAILVLYILFLPPEERAELLGEENETDSDDDETESGYNKTLLKEKIGRLDYLRFDYREHDIPSFRVYSEKEGTALKSVSSLYVSSNLGNKKFYNTTFQVDTKYTSNIVLSFNVKRSRGRLELYLNGREIFNGVLREGTPAPIELPEAFLDRQNTLAFKVSSPGVAFWRTNEYLLENVLITGDVLDVTHSRSRQFFYISDVEKLNLDAVKLKYYPNCDSREVGPMLIYLNGEEVFSGVADCGIYNSLFLDKKVIFEDRNELEFVATEGSYLMDRVSVRTELEEILYPVYYFEIEDELFIDDELDEDFNVTMFLRFVNDDEKRLEYNINGIRRHIRTDELKFDAKLDDYVISGTNSLELVPQTVVDIAELKVILDED
ncbi:hypothetical protein HQ533_02655 [Candidatus Woesearchaeota archaeon]|nr:hypothetical protein [Candidatus Woesearchaeota archaeon]